MSKKWLSIQKCYIWQALDHHGIRVNGKQIFDSLENFHAYIDQQHYTLLSHRTKIHIQFHFFEKKTHLHKQQTTQFLHELTELLQSDVTLSDALHLLSQTHMQSPLKNLVDRTKLNIEKGMELSRSLSQEQGRFDHVCTGLIAAGERAGNLSAMLKILTTHLFAMQALRQKMIRALYYPATVLIIACVITLGLIWFAVPQFQNMYRSLGSKLPALTQSIIHVSNRLHHDLPIGFTVIVGFLLLLRIVYLRNTTLRLAWQRFILQVPWLNRWQQIGFLTQWTKVLATTIQAGLPLLECLKLSERSTHNEALQQQLKKITANVAAGDNLANAITKHTIFPQQVHSLIQIGEQSGNLHTTLNHLAKQYQQKLNQKISSFT